MGSRRHSTLAESLTVRVTRTGVAMMSWIIPVEERPATPATPATPVMRVTPVTPVTPSSAVRAGTASLWTAALVLMAGVLVAAGAAAPVGAQVAPASTADAVPELTPLLGGADSEMVQVVSRFTEDRWALYRRYDAEWAPDRRERFRAFYREWRDALNAIDFDALGVEGRIDWVLLDTEIEYQLSELDRQERLLSEMHPLLPFADGILDLHRARRALEPVSGRAAAELLTELTERTDETRQRLEAAVADGGGDAPTAIVGLRAADAIGSLRRTLERWYGYNAGYDPLFTWWVEEPYGALDEAMEGYESFLRRRVVGYAEGEDPPIVGDPIGADGLEADLRHEMIPYTPAELIEIAEREYAWCEARMIEASRELGFGDDWLDAVEYVKTLHVGPGEQPELILDLYEQSVEFLRARDLVTIPPLAEEIWRMEMMSPERQKVAPFFLGGEVILVSYPTAGMEHADKLMSMRGNNPHFSRAVVHHELIPGHHLQGFMTDRYNAHRDIFGTPFWHEGNALYWEFRLWDMGFPRGPEDEVGMLFWRMHRAARIIFSLSFHLERMTAEEAIDFLVDRVGHERANATAEVRRSFVGTYPPLYQAGYMLGGLQFEALHEELVESGRMTEREYHDAILHGGSMPVEMVRARLMDIELDRDHQASWRFYDDVR